MDNWCSNEYRERYIHECNKCGQRITAYRICNKEHHSRQCDGQLRQVDFIPAQRYNFKLRPIKHSIVGRTIFSPEFGREISTSEINKLCKENNYVYADDKDLMADCARNKAHIEAKQAEEFRNAVIENTMRELS